jgi:CRP-like cAMP-binding protein
VIRSNTPRENERRIKTLREKLDKELARDELKRALPLLQEIEELEPSGARWPHKRGDVLRRLGKRAEAIAAYEKASALYSEAGFLPRAIAMAKVIAELNPTRIDVLEKIDPAAARELHRRVRPEGVHAGDRPTTRRMQEQALPFEPRPLSGPVHVPAAAPSAVSIPVPPRAPQARPPLPAAPPSASGPPPPGAPPPLPRARRLRRRQPSTIDIDLSELDLTAIETTGQPEGSTPPGPDAEREACLPLLPLFAEAPKEALLQLTRDSELIRLGHGDIVLRRGDPADALYGIVEGAVRVHVPGMPEEAWPRLGSGEVFGEACLLSSEPRRADVVADGELLALRIPKPTLNYLVRVHEGLADVLFELLTRRLITNLVTTSGLFAELGPEERIELAGAFELRRAQGGATMLARGEAADAILITLTGHVEIDDGTATDSPRIEGAGAMFGHATLIDGSPSGIGVRARETLLALRLPRDAFARVAMQYPAMLMRVSELEPVARVAQ